MSIKFVVIVIITTITLLNLVPTVDASDDEVLAKNTWSEVTKSDYYLELSRLPVEYRGSIEVSGKRVVELIDKILTRKSLADQARELKMDEEAIIQKRIKWLIDKTLSQVRIERLELAAVEDFEDRIAFFEKRASEVYTGNPDSVEFKTPFRVEASHILVDLQGRTREETKIRIESVREKALAGESFEDLALEYSDDPTVKQNKGDLGQFEPGQMVKSFEEAALKLEKPGDISAIVETSYGMHIIQLHSKSGGVSLTFDQAKPLIMSRLKSDFVKRVRIKHMQELDSDESLTIDEKAIDSLVVPVAG
jgi:peptidyl-prolyl cis-trans isomerase C